MKIAAKLALSLIIVWTCIAWMQQPEGLESHFQGFEGAFVLYDQGGDKTIRHNPKRCATRFSPYSTFKIPNSIMALEAGIAPDAHFYQSYQPELYPREDWMPDWLVRNWLKDHTLRSAYKQSVVWYYQELAKAAGAGTMGRYLERFQYGNQDISGGLTQFWLGNSLKISPDEQVAFLRKFYHNEFNLSEKTHVLMKDIMVLKQTAEYRISGKTGSNLEGFGWLVGYVETAQNTWFFAFNAELPQDKASVKHRLKLVEGILRDMDVI